MRKIRLTCKKCRDIFYYKDEAIEHILGEHPKIPTGSPEEILENFDRSL